MTDNVEDLLREGIDRLTAGAEVPAGLLNRALRRNRQRRRAIWTATAAGAAAVTAAAVIAATSAPEPHSGSLQQQDISYVVSRAQQALAGLTQANAIQVDEETANRPNDFGLVVLNMSTSGGTGIQSGVLGGVHADRMIRWTSTGLFLDQGLSADGKFLFASSIGNVTSRAGKKVQEAYGAAYSARIQWHSPLVGQDLPAPPAHLSERPARVRKRRFQDPDRQGAVLPPLYPGRSPGDQRRQHHQAHPEATAGPQHPADPVDRSVELPADPGGGLVRAAPRPDRRPDQ